MPASMVPWQSRSSRNITALLDTHTAIPNTPDRLTESRKPRRRPNLTTSSHKAWKHRPLKVINISYLFINNRSPVTDRTQKDVSHNPPCHEADVLQGDLPVVAADQVPLQRTRTGQLTQNCTKSNKMSWTTTPSFKERWTDQIYTHNLLWKGHKTEKR